MITYSTDENIFAISLPKCIDIAPLWNWEICVRMSDGICNMDYTGLKWSNINHFLVEIYSKYNFMADACNHNQMMNDWTIKNHSFVCNIIGNQPLKCALLHPCVFRNLEKKKNWSGNESVCDNLWIWHFWWCKCLTEQQTNALLDHVSFRFDSMAYECPSANQTWRIGLKWYIRIFISLMNMTSRYISIIGHI